MLVINLISFSKEGKHNINVSLYFAFMQKKRIRSDSRLSWQVLGEMVCDGGFKEKKIDSTFCFLLSKSREQPLFKMQK